jgi:hypothetical protein
MKARFPALWRNLLALFAIAALIAAHGALLRFWVSHQALPIAVVCGLVLLIMVKHLGLAGPVYLMLPRVMKRRGRR